MIMVRVYKPLPDALESLSKKNLNGSALFEVDLTATNRVLKAKAAPVSEELPELTDQLRMVPLLRMNRRWQRAQGEKKRHVG